MTQCTYRFEFNEDELRDLADIIDVINAVMSGREEAGTTAVKFCLKRYHDLYKNKGVVVTDPQGST